jgi:GTP-binding protein EngB required for normal cell division
MNNGIIVLSIDNYQHVENYRIIGRLQKVINKPIENFLILLNKIDKSENKNKDLEILNNKIMKYFPSCERFNPTKNLIIPCSKLQLENELKMDKCFKNLLYYHFLNFLMKSKAKTPDTPTTSGSSFIDFLKSIYSEQKIKKKKFIEKITKVIDDSQLSKILKEITDIIIYIKEKHQDENLNLGVRDDDFKEEDIENIKNEFEINENEEQNEQEEDEENENFNLSDLEGNVIILLYYSDFKNKKNMPPKSQDTEKIMKYFTMENMNKKKEDEIDNTIKKEIEKKINEEKSKAEKIDDLSKKMLRLYDKCKEENLKTEKLKQLQKYINSSIGILKTSKQLYIPMLGLSNAGKSTILNGIVGSRILPTEKNECTKKGILIKHWNKEYPVIRKTKFKKEKLGDEDIYYFESNEKFITKGLENIHHVLEGTNGEFTQNEENFFYEININIKFVNDLKIDDNLKEKICFIDLPGFGTANVFERKDIYAHLMKSCNIFLFVAFNLTIKENNNKKMLDNLYNTMSQFIGIPTQAFIKKCIFIVNCDKDQDMSNKNLNQAKKDIIQIINGLDESILNDINVCFFNAKYYENFIFKTLSYNSTQSLIYDIYNTYNQLKEGKFKGYIDTIKRRDIY